MSRKILFALGLSCTCLPVLAQPDIPSGYLGINYVHTDHQPFMDDLGFPNGELTNNALQLRLGGRVSNWFATELRVATDLERPEENGWRFKQDYQLGALARIDAHWQIVSPYLVTGVLHGRRSLKRPVVGTEHENYTDLALGLGMDLMITRELGFNLEYLRYADLGSDAYKVTSAGLVYRF
ncbi:outer membrane beta-barrel protein [Marinospirillum sp. MEB164]|uniref:Outer membrane beta-barrel protein n=1 Tax=Marinospirillum alkalitolerans TaxID=3123374 RepID=A0ABW8PWC7_9GAMM